MNKLHNHFDDEIWLDIVRGVPTAAKEEVVSHLNSGCETCESSYRLWLRVRDWLPEAMGQSPSPEAVKSVLGAFDFHRRMPLLPRIAEMARLVFDSFLEPAPYGIRGGTSPARHLMHETESSVIDMRIEKGQLLQRSLTGQVMNLESMGDPSSTAAVFLVEDGDRIIGSTVANSLGEFQLDFEARPDLSIYFDMAGAAVVRIALPDLRQSTSS